MANTILLEVVTPDRRVFSEPVEFFSVRGQGGELGILPGHIPLFTGLNVGLLHYKKEGRDGVIAVMGGFLNVQPTHATVLADAAELAEDIDAARAKIAREKAQANLSDMNGAAAQAALDRATVRLRAVDLVGNKVTMHG